MTKTYFFIFKLLLISVAVFTSCNKDDELSKGEWVEINGIKWASVWRKFNEV